MNHVIGSIAL